MVVLKILLGVFVLLVIGVLAAGGDGGSCVCHVPPATHKPPGPPKG